MSGRTHILNDGVYLVDSFAELFGKDFLCPTVSMHLVTQRKGKVHAVGHKKLEIVFLFFLFHLPEREYEREK